MLRTPVQQFLRRCFTDGELIRLLAHLGYPNMPALLHAGMLYLFAEDYWQPRAGLYGFVKLLAEHVQQAGGIIVTGTTVKSIIVENGQARGVILENGDAISADAVISCIDYNLTYQSLIPEDQLPKGFLQVLAKRRPSEAYITVCLVTNLPTKDLKSLVATNTFYFPERKLPRGMVVTAPGLWGETDAKAQTPLIYLSYQCAEHDNLEESKADLINAACKLLPGLERHILFAEVWYPERYEQEFGGFGGASAGWSLDPAHMLRRGFPGWQSPILSLYHASQWTYSPGGVPAAMLSARQASRHIIKH
jgi:phytoene dehydrogenase-like protein